MPTATFAARLLRWFAQHGRHGLPWQQPREAYRVWISEVMLQQTQVSTVIPYFERFMAHFPDAATLAAAPIDEVLRHWAGLGYYARARNLHRAAQLVVEQHDGEFPRDFEAVSALPGIGRSTAGAILAQACGQRHAILDGNVRRVLARHGGIEGWPGQPRVQAQMWRLAEARLPTTRLADYTQAIMDLGNVICRARAPLCAACPVAVDCVARREDRVQTLPSPKPRRARPKRVAQVLLLTDVAGRVLIERRPPAGIWGGLWCPPLSEAGESWVDAAQRLGHLALDGILLDPIHHAFTHFDLELVPVRLRAHPWTSAVREPDGRAWIKLDRPQDWPGLPAPIRKLLERLHPQLPLQSTQSKIASPPMSRIVHCIKLDKEAEGLDRPPYPGALGQRLFESASKEAWQLWLAHQTRLINEYRLALSDASARKFLAAEMEKYFFGGGELAQTSYTPPKNASNS